MGDSVYRKEVLVVPTSSTILSFIVALVMVSLGNLPANAQTEGKEIDLSGPIRKTDKIRFTFKVSRLYLLGGTALDSTSTALALNHPTRAWRADGSPLARYHGVETGWARFLGARNTVAVNTANMALSAGVDLLSRKLYQRGGRWRYLAICLNLWRATDGLVAGIRNLRYNGSIDRRVRLATGYSGPVAWSQ